jgi:branched-chain amino acid transport system ATP-binding protein
MNPQEMAQMTSFIAGLPRRFDVTILLIEHQLKLVMNISDHVSVFEYGRKITDGTPEEVRAHPGVIRAYLGGRTAERALQTHAKS